VRSALRTAWRTLGSRQVQAGGSASDVGETGKAHKFLDREHTIVDEELAQLLRLGTLDARALPPVNGLPL
jgi:hypothetical protein